MRHLNFLKNLVPSRMRPRMRPKVKSRMRPRGRPRMGLMKMSLYPQCQRFLILVNSPIVKGSVREK